MIAGRKAQGGPEFNVVISFIVLVFIVVMFISMQKQSESYELQVFLDAKKVAMSVADNINMISKNGDGYYRYFSLQNTLYGNNEYNVTAVGHFVEISYDDGWAAAIISSNISILRMEAGDSDLCISNINGEVVINDICNLSDRSCGSVQSCDPGDLDDCASCDAPDPVQLNENSLSRCLSYGCSTDEWHIYKVIPSSNGDLEVTFSGSGTMAGEEKSELIFYDYNATGCANPTISDNIEGLTMESYPVQSGNVYIIAIDVDASNCTVGGDYTLKTKLI
jgi:hypothetical protein